jgi:histidyl-tRNA synthetase
MRDFLPEDVRRRQYVIGVIADVYQRYGFEPLETPAAENIDTLMGKYGEEGDRLIFRILKRGEDGKAGEADLALRYDLTVPLARVVAQYRAQLPKFFKRYQVQPVWRADRPQKGRFREFYQCDVDAIGSTSLVVEAELLAAAAEIHQRLGLDDFRILVNHRRLLSAVLSDAGILPTHHGTALVALDKLDKTTPQAVAAELSERGVSAEAAAAVLTRLTTGLTEDVQLEGAQDLRTIVQLCEPTPAAGRIARAASAGATSVGPRQPMGGQLSQSWREPTDGKEKRQFRGMRSPEAATSNRVFPASLRFGSLSSCSRRKIPE